MRAFDVWVHEQDLRRALGQPGNLDSAGAHVARDLLVLGLPKVVAKNAGAPPHSAVVFDVSGPLEFMRTVRVDADGPRHGRRQPLARPGGRPCRWTGRRTCVWPAGRVRPEAVADQMKIEGDAKLAKAILENFSVTP